MTNRDNTVTARDAIDLGEVKRKLVARAAELGFNALGVANVEISEDEGHLIKWLERGFHGEMGYMTRHGLMRSRPQALAPGTVRVLSARMDYWPDTARAADEVLADGVRIECTDLRRGIESNG